MNVLIFSTAYFPHVGGAEVAVKEITDRISDIEFDMVTVKLDKNDKAQEKIGNVTVYRLGWGLGRLDKFLFPFRANMLANKLHRDRKYRVAWSVMASFSGFAALFFKKDNPSVQLLLTLQEGDDLKQPERKARIVHGWFQQIFTKADYIQCISSYLAKWAKEMGATCSTEVIPNGVAISKLQIPSNKSQTNLKSKILNLKTDLKINEADKVILTTSRLVKKNGIADLIKAAHLLIIRYSLPVTLIICGSGELEKDLRNLTKKLNIEDKVKFSGFIKPSELQKFYKIADVFCRPSLTEGLGNSFLEAMAAGLPVVATPVGGIPDFLEDGKTGWFCKVKNPESIAEKVKYILDKNNKDKVEDVKNKAKKLVAEKYDWDIISKQMKNIFSALGGSASG